MAKRKGIQVYPDGDVWVVKKYGSTKASAIRNTKEEAWEAARSIAINQNLSVTIHGRDGKIIKTVTPRQAAENDCFLTTACVKYFKLRDNCHQLQTLRRFRDEHLLISQTGKLLVLEYYHVAPILVNLLESDKNKAILFNSIFKKINLACEAIDRKQFKRAERIYVDTVIGLSNHFKLA